MDKNLKRYLRDTKSVLLIAVALALGLILIFIGSYGGSDDESATGVEQRLAAACSAVAGVGECEGMIYFTEGEEKGGSVESVIVICEGADSVEVRLRLTEMLSSFFGIGTNRVRIEKRK